MEWKIEFASFLLSVIGISLYHSYYRKKYPLKLRNQKAYETLIGNTPLIQLHTLSKIFDCEIFVKVRNEDIIVNITTILDGRNESGWNRKRSSCSTNDSKSRRKWSS